MVLCFAPGCDHRHPSNCQMFKMPTDEKQAKIWIQNLSCRTDRKPTENTRVCSCHFKDGKKENGPTIFKHNLGKQFQFQSPEKKSKKRKVQNVDHISKKVLEFTSDHLDYSQPSTSSQPQPVFNLEIEQIQPSSSNTLHLKQELIPKLTFSYNQIKDSNKLIKLYTGLPDQSTFNALYTYLTSYKFSYYLGWQVTSIQKEDQLLLTLVKLRLNSPHLDLANRFQCSSSTVTNIFLTWIFLMHSVLYKPFLTKIPSRNKCRTCLPNSFSSFTNCRLILDCTEIKIEVPFNMKKQRESYSSYKHANTYKALVGVAPNGVIVFVSDLYPGSISDKQIFISSKVSEQLIEGDMILVDKGFLITDVVPAGVFVNIPPFLMTGQFSRKEALCGLQISRCRVHVERANCRIKNYRILDLIPQTLRKFSSVVFKVCCCLVNLQNPLIKEVEPLLDVEETVA